jgi:hypothetical protein
MPYYLIVMLSFIVSQSAHCETVPLLLNYQGRIEGVDSLLTLTFSISETEASPGNTLWEEMHDVQTQDGGFSVLLGGLNPFDPAIFAKPELYLSLKVDEIELAPRQRIVSAAYAIRSSHASDVSGERITPAGIALAGGEAFLDSTGVLSANLVSADSLVIGGTPVIDGTGTWVGQPISDLGLSLRSMVHKVTNEPEFFSLSSKWVSFDQFDTFVEFGQAGKLDMSFVATITSSNPFQTRIRIKQTSPENQFLGQFGNISGAQASPSFEGSTVYNQAVIDLEAGTYRILIEHSSTASFVGSLKSGSLIVRILY